MLNWYVLNTKPHSERIVRDKLAERGIAAYLPLYLPPAARAPKPQPFFPRYLFANADLDEVGLSTLKYLPGVHRLVLYGSEPARVPQVVIDRIQERIDEFEQRVSDALGQTLQRGDRVKITGGPLAGVDAIFDGPLSSSERVRLLVNFLQQGAHVEIERGLVQKVTWPSGTQQGANSYGRQQSTDARLLL